jgi:hypothetical protein
MVDRVQAPQPTPSRRRLLARLCLFAFFGGLLLLLSSRPAEAAERREPGLLDPVRTTLKATAREVELAGRAAGSGTSTVGKAGNQAVQAVAPQPRPATSAARPAAPAVKRGAPAVTSPVRRVAPPTRPVTTAARTAARSSGPAGRIAKVAAGPVGRVAEVTSPVTGPATGPVGRIAETGGRALAPLGAVTAPVLAPLLGSALGPVGSALAPIAGAVGGVVSPVVPGGLLPLPGLPGPGSRGGPWAQTPAATFTDVDGAAPGATVAASFETIPARPAADGASSPAARSTRSWPALTGAVSLPGFPTSAELPAGGPDPLSTSSGAGFALVALAAALLLLGLSGRGRARPDGSGVLSRSYLPAVSPA